MNTKPFSKVDSLQVIIMSGGVQKQVDVYERESTMYANAKGGFVTLYSGGTTSVPSLLWKAFIYPETELPEMEVSPIGFLQLV